MLSLRSLRSLQIPKLTRSFCSLSDLPKPVKNPFDLAKHLSGKHFIDGELQPSKSGSLFEIINPATGKVVAEAARGMKEDVDEAVQSALQAQREWAKLSEKYRGEMVTKCGEALKKYAGDIDALVSLETGKAIRTESRVEYNVLADVFTFFGNSGREMKGHTFPLSPTTLTYTKHEPLGVIGCIIPWNVPLLLFAMKVAPALVAGNSVVVKSSELAPLGVLRVVEILNKVLPKGLVNIISGFGPECGEELVVHPNVAKIAFTGSVKTGQHIYRKSADKIMPLTLELGGKSPMIVCEDSDVEKAVDGAIVGMRFTRAGQSCSASSRIFIHENIFENFVNKLKSKVDELKMGDPLKEETDMGCIISKSQFEKVTNYIEMGKKEGANVIQCSKLPTDPELKNGLFVQPVLFTDISHQSRVVQEEIFGPVTCLFKWKELEEAIEDANSSCFGLAASIWTSNLQTAMKGINRLEAGIVQVNQNLVLQPNLPIGGIKLSGIGREGSLECMLEHFTRRKTVSINMI